MLDKIKKFFEVKKISKILITKATSEDIIDFAKTNYPKEFVALLSGHVKEDMLIIDGLLYQPYKASPKSAFITFSEVHIPEMIGTVHSHPRSSTRPSDVDLTLFAKKGAVHIIIGYPYTEDTISCYDSEGNRMTFKIEAGE